MQVKHSYPFCWRSQTPLLQKAVPSWFMKVQQMRERLLSHNEETYWVRFHFLSCSHFTQLPVAPKPETEICFVFLLNDWKHSLLVISLVHCSTFYHILKPYVLIVVRCLKTSATTSLATGFVMPETGTSAGIGNVTCHYPNLNSKISAGFDLTCSRYWGTPIPVWISEDGEEQVLSLN